MRRLFSYAKKYRLAFIMAPLLVVVDVVAELFAPTLMANIVDVGIANADVGYIVRIGLYMVGLCAVSVLANVSSVIFAARGSQGLGAEIRKDLFGKIQSYSFEDIDRFSTSSLITRLTNDVNTVQHTAMMFMRMMVRAPITMVTALVFALTIDAELSLILLVAIPILFGVVGFLIVKSFPLFTKMQQRLDHLNQVVQENLTGIRVVKSYNREGEENRKFKKANRDLTAIAIKGMELVALAMPVVMMILNLAIVAVYWFGGHKVVAGTLLPGELISLNNYITHVLMSMMMLSMNFLMYSRSRASIARINEVLDCESSIRDGAQSDARITRGEVRFEDVSFHYGEGNGEETLHDISFVAAPGETIAVVGATGSGKSSLVQLIPRFYDVSRGRILIDGVDVRDYTLKNLREGISMVLQTNTLFSGTIASNMRWGDESADDATILAALKEAQAWEFVSQMEGEMEAPVERGGLNYSGGQRQRLCIARSLVQDPRILILDDSTSAVDTTTEASIRRALMEHHPDTTVFIIAQRISSVRNADRILVLDEGTLADMGTHEELMETSEIYREIYHSQVKGGEEDE